MFFCCRFLQTISGHISRTLGPLIYFVWEASIIRVSQTFTTHCQIKCSYHLSLQWISAWNVYIWWKWNYLTYLLWITYNTYYVDAVTPLHYISASKLIIYVLITIDTGHVICSVHVLLHISFIPVSPVFLPFMEFECSFYCCQAKQRNKNTPLPLLW